MVGCFGVLRTQRGSSALLFAPARRNKSRAGGRITELPGSYGPVAITPCGGYALTGAEEQAAILWRLGDRSAEELTTLRGHSRRRPRSSMKEWVGDESFVVPDTLSSLAISPCGSYDLTTTLDQAVVWELDLLEGSARLAARLEGAASCGAFSPDGGWIVAGATRDSAKGAHLWRLFSPESESPVQEWPR
ncbi:MAG: hypothetical protein JKY65_19340 [Planctomycetes bacterium]|nr:hypothetical protein [Planctomycetota bacterium]